MAVICQACRMNVATGYYTIGNNFNWYLCRGCANDISARKVKVGKWQ